jgi:AraC-like DNA-binding protein/quercetin dioxygenase-like cupin family protein
MGSPRYQTVEANGFLVTDAWFSPFLRLTPHYHDRACFAVMLEGSFDVQFTRITHACPPGSVEIEPAGERHGNRVERAGAHVLVVQPDPGREDLSRPCAAVLDRVTYFRHGGITSLAWRLTRELAFPDAVTPLVLEGTAIEMLAIAARLDVGGRTARRPPAWLSRATDLLHARFLNGLRAIDVAGEVGVHPVHLTRVFRAHHGVSLGAYVRGLRLDWAARRLARSHEALGDIALEAGFADQSHFTRAFKRHTGSTPAQFRRRMTGAR